MGQPKQWNLSGDVLSPNTSVQPDISNGITALYNTDVEQLTDGSFEDWEITGYTPDDFGSDNPLGATVAQRFADSHAGDYAILLTADAANGPIYISDMWANEGAMAEDEATLQVRMYAKRGTGSGNLIIRYLCYDGETEYTYNFTGVNAGTWTETGGPPSSDQMETLTLTNEYAQVTSTQVTIPVGYTGGMALFIAVSSNTGDTVLVDDFELLIDASDEAVNGNFESWTAVEELTYWESGDLNEANGEIVKEETIVYSGDYAVRMETYDGNKNYVAQLIEGTEAEALTCSYFARGAAGNAGTVNTTIYFLNNTFALADEVWNKTTSSWEAYTNFAGLDSDNITVLSINASETFTQDTAVPTIPASGKVLQVVYGESDVNDDLIYVDLASATKEAQGYGPLVTVDSTTGKVTFDAEVAVDEAISDTSAVNLGQLKSTGVVLLGSVTVDMTATAATTLYTASGNVMPLFITQRCITQDTITNPAVWSIGTNSTDFNNYVASGGATASVVDYAYVLPLGGIAGSYPILGNTDILKLNVTTGATATAHTVTWDVFGIIL